MNEYEFNGFVVKTNYSKNPRNDTRIKMTDSNYDKYSEMENNNKCIIVHFGGTRSDSKYKNEEDVLNAYTEKCSKIMFADTMVVRGCWVTEYAILYPRKEYTTENLY